MEKPYKPYTFCKDTLYLRAFQEVYGFKVSNQNYTLFEQNHTLLGGNVVIMNMFVVFLDRKIEKIK